MAESIGILGGTFDPVHYGHLRPALDVAEQLNLAQIYLIPNAIPPHRAQPQATAEQRLEMLHLAIKDCPEFVIDDRELQRQGESYTVDTLLSLRQDFPENPLYLLIGTDAFLYIQTWHRWQELLQLAHIVVMERPDEILVMPDKLNKWYQQYLASKDDAKQFSGKIWPVKVTQLAISATEIRQKIAQGLTPQFLLPDTVIHFIKQSGLYQDG